MDCFKWEGRKGDEQDHTDKEIEKSLTPDLKRVLGPHNSSSKIAPRQQDEGWEGVQVNWLEALYANMHRFWLIKNMKDKNRPGDQ